MILLELLPSLFAAVLAAMASACIIWAVRPLLLRHALAKPNARSSHSVPTPQGAGIAVIAATLAAASAVIAFDGNTDLKIPVAVYGASLFMAIVGFTDDVRSIPVISRLLLQTAAVGSILYATSSDLRIIPICPFWIERALLLVAGLWFVNLVNFMDGLDWITVAEVVPVTMAIVMLGWLGAIPQPTTIVAAALCGAMIGFAPFNRPVAKIFLGDVGSLPIGLLLGWCLLQLAYHHDFIAALLLPLYYLSDATVTLARRITKREPVWIAHREHFYQRATDNGFTVKRVVSEIFVLNVILAILALASTTAASCTVKVLCLIGGGLAVAFLMYRFVRPRQSF